MHLGFGREDRFADSHRMMAAALSPECVQIVPGGHEWPVWTQLWDDFLESRFVRRDMRVAERCFSQPRLEAGNRRRPSRPRRRCTSPPLPC